MGVPLQHFLRTVHDSGREASVRLALLNIGIPRYVQYQLGYRNH
jgi:hypothetical protein